MDFFKQQKKSNSLKTYNDFSINLLKYRSRHNFPLVKAINALEFDLFQLISIFLKFFCNCTKTSIRKAYTNKV